MRDTAPALTRAIATLRQVFFRGVGCMCADDERVFTDAIAAIMAATYRRAISDAQRVIAGEDTVEWARHATGSTISLPTVIELLDDLIGDGDE